MYIFFPFVFYVCLQKGVAQTKQEEALAFPHCLLSEHETQKNVLYSPEQLPTYPLRWTAEPRGLGDKREEHATGSKSRKMGK